MSMPDYDDATRTDLSICQIITSASFQSAIDFDLRGVIRENIQYEKKVAAFAVWDVFPAILNAGRCGFVVNA